jgi:4-alpha-glucanotransferase
VSDDAILDLACKAGIAVEWVDAAGRPQRVGIDSLRRLLDALGFPSVTSSEVTESRRRIHERAAAARLPPLITMRVGTRLSLPADVIDDDMRAELAFEDGAVHTARLVRRGRDALGPTLDRCGYHKLRFADRELTVAVAPSRCVTLDERGAGRRMWGVAAQVYGLRRTGDGGIGDATAVRQLAEAAAERGVDAVALSPVHSLFAADPGRYGPYSPSSRLFLNPLYADPAVLFGAERVARHAVPAAGDGGGAGLIDWRPAAQAKFALFRRLFVDFRVTDLAAGTPLGAEFKQFVSEGGEALRDHALFEALHAKWTTGDDVRSNWADWPAGWRHPDDTAIASYLQAEAGEVQYHQFLQWLVARSFAAAQAAAVGSGMRIGLIADLAIGMDRAGSHAWAQQNDILLGLSVGAPPDDFNLRGQDWGLAGFSPQALVAKGYEPFLATLRACLRYSGGVRIDHAMGLMRLWLIPQGAAPSEGAYLSFPSDDLLRLLALESQRHGAVVIGEDLGTVPPGFRNLLRRAGVAGMDILWFQRTRSAFKAPARWRSDAVAMTTTHDLPTVAGWWRGSDVAVRRELRLATEGEDVARHADRRRLWQAFGRAGVADGKPPPSTDPDPAVDAALAFVAASPAQLMLAPIEDMLGLADQPNLPGTIDEHPNWRRRLEPAANALFEQPEVQRRADIIARKRA